MKIILLLIMTTIAILLGVYGYNQEMKANDLEIKLEEQTRIVGILKDQLREKEIQLRDTAIDYINLKAASQRNKSYPRTNNNHRRIKKQQPIRTSKNNTKSDQFVHMCINAEENYIFSETMCSPQNYVKTIRISSGLSSNNQRKTVEKQAQNTNQQPKTVNKHSQQSDYSTIRKRLAKQCDHLKYGSLERRNCRKHLKQGFSKTCYSKREMSKPFRRANCSLADSFPVVE